MKQNLFKYLHKKHNKNLGSLLFLITASLMICIAQSQEQPTQCGSFSGRRICVGQAAITPEVRSWHHSNSNSDRTRLHGTISAINERTQQVSVQFGEHTRTFDFNNQRSALSLRTRESQNGYNTFRVGMEVWGCREQESTMNFPEKVPVNNFSCLSKDNSLTTYNDVRRITGIFRNRFHNQEDAPLYELTTPDTDNHIYTYYLAPLLHAAPEIRSLIDLSLHDPIRSSIHAISLVKANNSILLDRQSSFGPNDLGRCVAACQSNPRCSEIGFTRNETLDQAECTLFSLAPGQGFNFDSIYLMYDRGYQFTIDYRDLYLHRSGATDPYHSFEFMVSRSRTNDHRWEQPVGVAFYAHQSVPESFLSAQVLFPAIYLSVFRNPISRPLQAWHSQEYQRLDSQSINVQKYANRALPVRTPEECNSACNHLGTRCLGFHVETRSYDTFTVDNRAVYHCSLIEEGYIQSNTQHPASNLSVIEQINVSTLDPRYHLVAAHRCVAEGSEERPNLFSELGCTEGSAQNTVATNQTPSPPTPTPAPTPIPAPSWRFISIDIAGHDLGTGPLVLSSMNQGAAENACRRACEDHHAPRFSGPMCQAFSVQPFSATSTATTSDINSPHSSYLCWLKNLPPSAVALNDHHSIVANPSATLRVSGTTLTFLLPLIRSNPTVDIIGQCRHCSTASVHLNAQFDGYELERHPLFRNASRENLLDQCITLCDQKKQTHGCNAIRLTQITRDASTWSCLLQSLPNSLSTPHQISPPPASTRGTNATPRIVITARQPT